MGCFVVVFALISPRLALFLVWVFTDFVSRAFDGFLLPLLGFFFLPWTTLAYALLYKPVTGLPTFGWFVVIFAFIVDLGSYGGAYRKKDKVGGQG